MTTAPISMGNQKSEKMAQQSATIVIQAKTFRPSPTGSVSVTGTGGGSGELLAEQDVSASTRASPASGTRTHFRWERRRVRDHGWQG